MAGGLLALGLRDKLHLILGFSAGAVIGVAFFDLLPEAIDFGFKFHSPSEIMSFTRARLSVLSRAGPNLAISRRRCAARQRRRRGAVLPQFTRRRRDRARIPSLARRRHHRRDRRADPRFFGRHQHDEHRPEESRRSQRRISLARCSTRSRRCSASPQRCFSTLPGDGFGIVLALFGGFFLYIGASDLIPESYHAHPKFLTTAMTLAGAARTLSRDQVIG